MTVAILDVDGTLVDTNYQHAIAWYRAFKKHKLTLPIWRIHRHIGMGGDQLVEALTDAEFEHEQGERIRSSQKRFFRELIDEVAPMADAHELMRDLRARGHTVMLASSATKDDLEHYLELLDAHELADGWTSADDVARTKPSPDLVQAALDKASAKPQDAVMIGDSPWDAKAAGQLQVPTIAVLSGGFSAEELLQAGAVQVFDAVTELLSALDTTVLR
jgi:HAD superfamily hydrolase (TIGR01509 family)